MKHTRWTMRVLSLLLSLTLCSGFLSTEIWASDVIASGTCGAEGDGSNMTWTLYSDGLMVISGADKMQDWNASSVPWHSQRAEIKRVTISGGVTNIGKWAFYQCRSLTSVIISNSVVSIGDYAFADCGSSLIDISIPNSVKSIGEGAFRHSGLVSITIPNSVTSIGNSAFFECWSLTSVTIQNGVTSIGRYTFGGCDLLTSVTIPISITSIEIGAFYQCNSLSNVFYGGNNEQWKKITIGERNTHLLNATFHYDSNGSQPSLQPSSSTESEYIYDVEDPGESVTLDAERLKTVTDADSAAAAVRDQVKSMTSAQKASATGTDLASLYAETAASKVASKTVSGNEIVINKAAVTELTANSNEALKAVETELSGGGITTARELSRTVTFRTNATGEITVRVEPDVLTAEVDRFIVETPTYALTLRAADLKDTLSSGAVVIRAQDVGPYAMASHSVVLASASSIPMAGGMTIYESPVTQETVYAAANGTTQVKLTLPAGFSEPVTLSMPGSAAQDTTVKDSTGAAAPSKYNPATARVDSWVNASGTYAAQSNEKDFVDIANKSAEMQRAIRYLASRGIINGTDETHFNPDGSITRAEIAALLVRTLGRLDKNAKPTFTDVKSSNWYYATAASSQKAGLIKGYEDNTFRGGNQINKEQIVAVSARVLTKEMGYKTPTNTASYLKKYSDSVVEWARPEVALATKENLVVYRKDGMFRGGAGMTRGDAAIIIYRVFMKIW